MSVVLLAAVASVRAADPPAAVTNLLEAQGKLEAGVWLAGTMPVDRRKELAASEESGRALAARIRPACLAMRATQTAERVWASLQDALRPDLAARVLPDTPAGEPDLSPVFPEGVPYPGGQKPAYGRTRLTDDRPSVWATPAIWTGELQTPLFAGWELRTNAVFLTPNCGSLVRSDFRLGDAVVTGEVQVTEGDGVFLILRSFVLVKFHPGRLQGSGGNVNVKFGYDNLRLASVYGKAPELLPDKWYPFRVTLQAGSLQVRVGETDVLSAVVPPPASTKDRKTDPASGHFGFGTTMGVGGFRGVEVTALTDWGKRRLPRFPEPEWVASGAPLQVLSGPATNFTSLVHQKTESYKPTQHRVENGTLYLKGAPYAQFSHRATVGTDFLAKGRLRFREEGTVWFRANNRLLFGLRCGSGKPPLLAKHSTENFHAADEEWKGEDIAKDRWYAWELEYHEPAGTFRLETNAVTISVTPAGRDASKEGPSQFGISTYNTEAEVTDVTFEHLARGGTGDRVAADLAARLLREGTAAAGTVRRALAASADPNDRLAADVLEGKRAADCASAEDYAEVAARFRQNRDWPAHLAVLEAGYLRFPSNSPHRAQAEAMWKQARDAYDVAVRSVGSYEMGPDNVLRMGSEAVRMCCEVGGGNVWLLAPDTHQLLRYEPGSGKVARRVTVAGTATAIAARPSYVLLGGTDEGKAVAKVNATNGQTLATAPLAAGTLNDIVPHPKRRQSFVAADENREGEALDFAKFKIHVLDEDKMEWKETPAIGMFLCADPLGRYLYAGFHVMWMPGTPMDVAFLAVRPVRGHIDHLVRYRLTPEGPVLDAQCPAPGIHGLGLAADSSGGHVCYVARGGMGPRKPEEAPPHSIGAYRATSLNEADGWYDAAGEPHAMDFHPFLPEAYLVAGRQIRTFGAADFRLRNVASLSLDGAVTDARVSPDGRELLISFVGKNAGVYVHRLAVPAEPDPKAILAAQAGAAVPADAPVDVLKAVAERLIFTDTGEAAAGILLEREKSPYVKPAVAYRLTAKDLQEAETEPALPAMSVPAEGTNGPGPLAATVETNRPFRAAAEMLVSLEGQAAGFRKGWLWKCHAAEKAFPESTWFHLEAARFLKANGDAALASDLAGRVASNEKAAAGDRARAFSLLAEIYGDGKDAKSKAQALAEAAALVPRDAGLHARLGSALAAAGLPRRARYHRLLSWYLFPSRPGLAEEMAKAGLIPPETPVKLGTSGIFRKCWRSVVLISGPRGGLGTGFAVGRNGLILTNYHVAEQAKDLSVKVKTADGSSEVARPARVIAWDPLRDAALLAVDPTGLDLDPLVLADSSTVKTGDPIVAIGNPGFGSRILSHTATEGIVSGMGRVIGSQQFFQISAAVNPGNSGGPLLNEFGQVIGMVTLKADLENVGFALPSRELLSFLEEQEKP